MQNHFSESGRKPVELEIVKIVSEGYGMAFSEGKTFFTRFVLPGEKLIAKKYFKKKGVYFVEDYDLVSSSPDRISPRCPVFGKCGGCELQMTDYENQLVIKKEILADTFKRIARVNELPEVQVIYSKPWNYRFRARFQVEGKSIGFFKHQSNELVEVEECLIADEGINKALAVIKSVLKDSEDSPFLSTLKSIEIRTNLTNDTAMMIFVASSGNGVKRFSQELEEKLSDKFENLSFVLSLSRNRLPGKGFKLISGKEKIYFQHGVFSFGFAPLSFFQPNITLAFKVYELIKRKLKEVEAKKVTELFSGSGVLSILISDEFEVLGVEANPFGWQDALENAFINERNASFVNALVEDIENFEETDTLVINPPKSGLKEKTVEAVQKSSSVRNIFYLSCNPATIARDTGFLNSYGFQIKEIYLIDFYPQTAEIETLILLSR